MMNKSKDIEYRIAMCCKAMLNDDYHELCLKIKADYLKLFPEAMNQGKAEIWVAAIIWAAGTLNFLSDQASKPYATLNDVCSFFGTKNSTVGSKAGHIRKTLGMDRLNTDYMFSDSSLASMLNSMCMTEDGFIFINKNIQKEEEYLENDGQVDEFIITGYAKKPIKYARCLQYEYLFELMVNKWGEADGRKRKISFRWEELQYLTVEVNCTLTEAGELEERIRREGFE